VKVFISWSGGRSKGIASALHSWLPQVIQSVEPFMSATMDAGVKWNEVVNQNLDENDIGILCVTPENVERPWLNYEAGALSRSLNDRSRVIPYLLDFDAEGDCPAPLNQFNAALADQTGTWKVVSTLDGLSTHSRGVELKTVFDDYWWPKLRSELDDVRATDSQPPAHRPDSDKIDELLQNTRQLLRRGEGPDYDQWLRNATRSQDDLRVKTDDTSRLVQAALRLPVVRDVLTRAGDPGALTVANAIDALERAAKNPGGPDSARLLANAGAALKEIAGPSEWATALELARRGQFSLADWANSAHDAEQDARPEFGRDG